MPRTSQWVFTVYIPLNVTLAGHKEPDSVCVGRLRAALRVRPGPAGLRPSVCRGSRGQPAGDTMQCVQVRDRLVLQKVASEFHPKVRNHGEGPY